MTGNDGKRELAPSWSARLGGEDFSLSDAVGGPRGVAESLLPGVIFVATYVATGDLWWTIGLSAGVSILFVALRLVQRTPVTQAFAGFLGVLIGILWAASSGKAENYYAWGLLTNLTYGVILLLSIAVRQPAAAWAVQFLWGLPAGWKRAPQFRVLYQRCVWVTAIWAAVFIIRLSVQSPLYFSGAVASLGVAKLVLGLPLFALAVWSTWVLLREMQPAKAVQSAEIPPAAEPPSQERGTEDGHASLRTPPADQ